MTSKTVLRAWLYVLFAQVPLLFICSYILRLDDRTTVKWNASLLIMSLVIAQVLVVWHNLRTGNVDPSFRNGLVGRVSYVLIFVVMIALLLGLTWFAYVCFTSPEKIRSSSGLEVGMTASPPPRDGWLAGR